MYSVLLTLVLSPTLPDATPRASAGCFGSTKAAAGCVGTTAKAGCHGYTAGRHFRTPVRSSLHWLAHPRGHTTYYPATAVYVPTATPTQTAAPPLAAPVIVAAPAFRTPVRSTFCPGGRCPRQ